MAVRDLPDREYLRQCFAYDRDTGELFWLPMPQSLFREERIWKMWHTKNLGHRAGFTVPGEGGVHYWVVSFFGRMVRQHRIIWKWMTGDDIPLIDHWDRDGLNNAWCNLRAATKAQNASNSRVHADKASGLPKGVWKHRNRFVAEIHHQKVKERLGSFDTPEEAHAAYVEAAKRLHGEFFNPG